MQERLIEEKQHHKQMINSSANMQLYLTINRPDKKPCQVKIVENATIIGRHYECDILVKEEEVSRRHAKIEKVKNSLYKLVDLNSKNGTVISLFPINEIQLLDGDKFQIGKTVFSVNLIDENKK